MGSITFSNMRICIYNDFKIEKKGYHLIIKASTQESGIFKLDFCGTEIRVDNSACYLEKSEKLMDELLKYFGYPVYRRSEIKKAFKKKNTIFIDY